ncbi:cytochrome c biogenesis CcdA family protein [Aeromicrobium tamlense]|uniref:Cytochrome c-type biogenesis protein n=1 Tax=Aeromicrobium tamlense TaxID=375541 RepID=A0ABX2SCT2_9ACTN|nr:cytochrome c biogenesis protein CcdA [Aeromicrobium tamlense]NYI36720.1 cytochrome c-type biogenesis protein [Aeromicrobium tamlense]
MISGDITEWFLDTAASGNLVLTVPVALLAGLVSFFSPCVVPLLPGYLSYVSGVAVTELETARRGRVVAGSLLFVLGFSAVFVAGGALFGAAGQQLLPYQREISIVAGILLVVMGLAFLGWVPLLQRDVRKHGVRRVGLVAAPLLGVVFGVGWTPCIGPTLTAVLALSANEATAGRGAFLALVYCLGLGLPFVVAALFLSRFLRVTGWVRRHQRLVSAIGAALLIATGVLLITGWWQDMVIALQHWISGFEVLL